jgi:hypothetical protein
MQSEYARLAGTSPAALTAAMEPYLPIIRVFLLLGPAAGLFGGSGCSIGSRQRRARRTDR